MKHDEPITRHKQSLQILLQIGSTERSVYLGTNFMYLTLGTMLKLGLTVQFLSPFLLFFPGEERESKRVKSGYQVGCTIAS